MRVVFGMAAQAPSYEDRDDDEGDRSDDGSQEEESIMSLTAPADFVEAVEGDQKQLFHINAHGKTCFSAREGVAASARMREILFIDQLKDRISKVPWQFPQVSENNRDILCNEHVYGHANIVLVSGVVRLSSDVEVGEGRK